MSKATPRAAVLRDSRRTDFADSSIKSSIVQERVAPWARKREGGPDRAAGACERVKDRLALPVREVAELLGISSAAVRLMIARGDLPGRKIGGGTERVTYIIPTDALLLWLEGTSRAAAEGAA